MSSKEKLFLFRIANEFVFYTSLKHRSNSCVITLFKILKFLSTGARVAGGDLTKNNSNYSTNQQLFIAGSKQKGRVVDSLDLENFLQPK